MTHKMTCLMSHKIRFGKSYERFGESWNEPFNGSWNDLLNASDNKSKIKHMTKKSIGKTKKNISQWKKNDDKMEKRNTQPTVWYSRIRDWHLPQQNGTSWAVHVFIVIQSFRAHLICTVNEPEFSLWKFILHINFTASCKCDIGRPSPDVSWQNMIGIMAYYTSYIQYWWLENGLESVGGNWGVFDVWYI